MGGNYVNRPSGRGKEFFGFLLILGLVAAACGILWWTFRPNASREKEPAADPASAGSPSNVLAAAESGPAENGGSGRVPAGRPPLGEVAPNGIGTYFRPSDAEMRHLWDIVRTSPHISANKLYSAVTANVEFMYLADNDTVNAAAALYSPEELGTRKKPALFLLGGYVRISRVVALAAAANEADAMNVQPRLVQMWGKLRQKFPESALNAFLDESGLSSITNNPQVVMRAREISCGMILATLAHEAGHHSLGHLHGGVDTSTQEVSRNREREADSFAASVMSVSPFGKYMLYGDLLFYAIDAKVGGGGGSHPYSKERFENLVRANPVLARTLGLGE